MRRCNGLLIVMLLAVGFFTGCSSDSSGSPEEPVDRPVPIKPIPIQTVEMDATYEYDSLNRLTAAYYSGGVVERYTYDEAGNLLSVERTVD